MSRPRDRRHGSSERGSGGSAENERPSPLGAGWPPLTTLYSRTCEDLSEPALVNGRLPLKDPDCPLCTLGEDLVASGYDPDQAAWAEREVVLAIHRGWEPRSILEDLDNSHGLEVSEAALEKHIAGHVPSGELRDLERMRSWSPDEFDREAWRGLFDTLYLIVEKTRQGVASGDLAPTVPEGLSAAKTLAELLSYSLQGEQGSQDQDSSLDQMQMFVAVLSEVIEDGVSDPAEREELYRRVREILAEQTEAPEGEEAPRLPRGREQAPGQTGTDSDGQTS